MILNAIAEKLKRQSKDDFKGRRFVAWLIVQAAAFGPAGEEEHVVWVAPSAASASTVSSAAWRDRASERAG